MIGGSQPLVSVLTPVYNGEKYLIECIESVLAQTYQNWEYIIVNNCSTDRTPEIIHQYAEKDPRIILHTNDTLHKVIQNHNIAFSLISDKSKYCKVLQSDDWLFPECIQRMTEVAEQYASVGIVGSYRLDEDIVNCDGLKYPSTVVPGREICRATLLGGPYVFGSPTTVMFRSDLIRQKKPFYNENNLHADTEACYDILRDSDFGYVHQVLSFTRRHNETESSYAKRMNTYLSGSLIILKKYGPVYLSEQEYNRRVEKHLNEYYLFLASSFLKKRDKSFWEYHKKSLQDLGVGLSYTRLAGKSFLILYNRILRQLQI
ncbi:MAG: glycosyltransferase family 2 protein [Nitrospirota bacterium]